jgi:hypothetical protein
MFQVLYPRTVSLHNGGQALIACVRGNTRLSFSRQAATGARLLSRGPALLRSLSDLRIHLQMIGNGEHPANGVGASASQIPVEVVGDRPFQRHIAVFYDDVN